jgi:hypothetical protein
MNENENLPEEGFVTPSLYNEEFQVELSELDKEIKDLEDLYRETKVHLESIRNSKIRGSLTFIQSQTENLVGIKNTKITALKAKIAAKKEKFVNTLKLNGMTDGEDTLPRDQLLRLFAEANLSYRTVGDRSKEIKILEDDFESSVDAVLAGDNTPVSTEGSMTEEVCEHNKENAIAEKSSSIGGEFIPKTDKYEVVSTIDGSIFIIDLENSDSENTIFIDKNLLGFDNEEKAVISVKEESGCHKAVLRGKEIEIVDIDEA